MANVENPYNTTLQNNLVVTTNMNDVVTINFTISAISSNSIVPSSVTIAKGSSINDSGIEVTLTMADINSFYQAYFTDNGENVYLYSWKEFLEYKFTSDCNVTLQLNYTRNRYSIDILDSSYNDVYCHPEFGREYSVTCINEADAFICERKTRQTPSNYNGSSALNYFYIVMDYNKRPTITITIPSAYKISEVWITNMPYPYDESEGFGYHHKAKRENETTVEYDIEISGEGLVNNDFGFVISKV